MNLVHELATLSTLSATCLRRRYAEVFGEPTRSANKTWLVKRIAWHLQALAEGDLSERARVRAAELAHDADLRLRAPRIQMSPALLPAADGKSAAPAPPELCLPAPGGILTRLYKGRQLEVTVLHSGFAYQGQVFASLSAVAKAITGSHCSGWLFFGLRQKEVGQ